MKDKDKALRILKKIKYQLIDYKDFSFKDLEQNIDNLLSLNKNFATLTYITDNENEEQLASLPVMLIALINDELITNEHFFEFIKKYELEELLPQCFSIINGNLLQSSIYYKNLTLFNYFFDNFLDKININHQNIYGKTALHICGATIKTDQIRPYLEKMIKNSNTDINIKSKDGYTAYEAYNDEQKKIFEQILIETEKETLEKKLLSNINPNKKIKV
jgi:hypothetical protein